MSSESGLTCDEILEYLLQHDGRVRNKEFVTHFKHYLTGSPAQEEARLKFKEFVNYLATTKKEDDVKYVILRKKFFPNTVPDTPSSSSLSSLSEPTVPLSESTVSLSPRAPPPYRPPPPVTSPTPSVDSMISRDEFSFDNVSQCSISSDVGSLKDQHDAPPQAPPRRRTLEKLKIENKENISNEMPAPSEAGEKESTDSEIVSVKERMQKFNRMAETDLKSSSSQSNLRKRHEKGADDDDGVSVTSMDTKTRDWIIRSSLSDYQVLAKLATENPRLVRFKDPITGYTALHWAAKHGNEDVIKLIAGTHGANVNVRTNGGYTPLHLAAQFGHENLYDLLVKVYKADQNIRDWSGKKAYSYLQTTNKSVSAETFRSEYITPFQDIAVIDNDNKEKTARKKHKHRRKTTITHPLELKNDTVSDDPDPTTTHTQKRDKPTSGQLKKLRQNSFISALVPTDKVHKTSVVTNPEVPGATLTLKKQKSESKKDSDSTKTLRKQKKTKSKTIDISEEDLSSSITNLKKVEKKPKKAKDTNFFKEQLEKDSKHNQKSILEKTLVSMTAKEP